MTFDRDKWNRAATRQREKLERKQHPQEEPPKGVTLELYHFQCWDCDKTYLVGDFFLPSIPTFAERIKCPRHPTSHQDIEYMGRGRAHLTWPYGPK